MSLGLNGGGGSQSIMSGTYVGTGTSGETGARSLTFPRKPVHFEIFRVDPSNSRMNIVTVFMYVLTSSYRASVAKWKESAYTARLSTDIYAKFDSTTNTLSWYGSGTNGAIVGMNANGNTYSWMAYFD